MATISYRLRTIARQLRLLALIGGAILVLSLGFYVFGRLRLAATSDDTTQPIRLLQGQWSYLPGASVRRDGLHISHTGLQIVEQDGSGGQPNPPVNEYGTHLAFSGDVAISAKLVDIHGTAVLRLYARPPVIQDEFRVEPPSVQLAVTPGMLTVKEWDGKATRNMANQQPVLTKHFRTTSAAAVQLEVVRQHNKLAITVNGKQVGTVPAQNIFQSGRLWFGADAPTAGDSWTLLSLQARPFGNGSAHAVDTSKYVPAVHDPNGLQALAGKKRPGFLIGSALALAPLVSDAKYTALAFGGNFGAMTVENALKFQFVHPQPDIYTFQEADALVNDARAHGLTVHGHALVFGEANPTWVAQLPTATQADKHRIRDVMTNYIQTVVRHFKGRVVSWDVVNEPMADYDDTPDGEGASLRNHIWYKAMGADYIALAFRTAHAADPQAKLFMNEYGLESDGERWDAFVTLVTQLKHEGVPIDGVGFEAHEYDSSDQIDPAVLARHIEQLASLGLKSRISEMDVYSDDGTSVQADQYANVLATCLREPACVSFTTWGFDDDYDMWQDDNHSLHYGQDLLYLPKAKPTPAVAELLQVLNR